MTAAEHESRHETHGTPYLALTVNMNLKQSGHSHLINCGLVMPYGEIDLDEPWLR